MALDADHIDLTGQSGDKLLDCYIFAGSDAMVCDVWSAGRHLVQNGRHRDRDRITAAYTRAMEPLRGAL